MKGIRRKLRKEGMKIEQNKERSDAKTKEGRMKGIKKRKKTRRKEK